MRRSTHRHIDATHASVACHRSRCAAPKASRQLTACPSASATAVDIEAFRRCEHAARDRLRRAHWRSFIATKKAARSPARMRCFGAPREVMPRAAEEALDVHTPPPLEPRKVFARGS